MNEFIFYGQTKRHPNENCCLEAPVLQGSEHSDAEGYACIKHRFKTQIQEKT